MALPEEPPAGLALAPGPSTRVLLELQEDSMMVVVVVLTVTSMLVVLLMAGLTADPAAAAADDDPGTGTTETGRDSASRLASIVLLSS